MKDGIGYWRWNVIKNYLSTKLFLFSTILAQENKVIH